MILPFAPEMPGILSGIFLPVRAGKSQAALRVVRHAPDVRVKYRLPKKQPECWQYCVPAAIIVIFVFRMSASFIFTRTRPMNSSLQKAGIVALLAALLLAPYGNAEARHKKSTQKQPDDDAVFTTAIPPKTGTFAPGTAYSLCFVPDGASCEAMLVAAIGNTRRNLLVQAYQFTSAPIAKAIVDAHARGVDVRVIVDKSQVSSAYTGATLLKNAGIPVVVDTKPAIAHNKVMIFDQQAVFTGSFNFTRSAQKRNAENGLLVRGDAAVARAYTDNWNARYRQSVPY